MGIDKITISSFKVGVLPMYRTVYFLSTQESVDTSLTLIPIRDGRISLYARCECEWECEWECEGCPF